MPSALRPRLGALLLAWALGVYGALGGLPVQPAHELHLALAHHAMGSLANLWSTRWDLGHSFAGHPPLFHQLVALLAEASAPFGGGLDRAYAVVVALVPVALTFAMGRFVERFASARAGDVAAWLTATNPLVWLFLFPFGQAPFLASTALALLGAACWSTPEGRLRSLAGGAAFAVASVSTHAVAFVPLGVGGLLALTRGRWSWRAGVGGSALVAGVVAFAALRPCVLVMWGAPVTPSSKKLVTSSLVGGVALGVVVWSAAVGFGLGGERGRWVAALIIGLGALALSRVPLGVASDKWLWLAVLFAQVAWGTALAEPGGLPRPELMSKVSAVVFSVLLLTCAYVLGGSNNDNYGHRNTALREARLVLEPPNAESFRYVTLHLGAARFELARRVSATSLDTGLPWVAATALRGTPFVNIDELPLGTPEGLAALDQVLANADEWHLRWVLCGDSRATEVLQRRGFDLRSAWKGDLTLWERLSVKAAGPAPVPAGSTSLPWAVVPLTCLFGAAALSVPWRRRAQPSGF